MRVSICFFFSAEDSHAGLALKEITFIGEEPSLSWLSDTFSISTWSAGNGHAVLPNRSIILMRVPPLSSSSVPRTAHRSDNTATVTDALGSSLEPEYRKWLICLLVEILCGSYLWGIGSPFYPCRQHFLFVRIQFRLDFLSESMCHLFAKSIL